MPVARYQAVTDVLPQAAVPLGGTEGSDSTRPRKLRRRAGEDGDVLPPMATPAVTTATAGWEANDSPLKRRRRLRTDETDLSRPDDAVPSGWELCDARAPRRQRIKRATDELLLLPPAATPAAWELADATRAGRRRRVRLDEEALPPVASLPATSFELNEASCRLRRLLRRRSDPGEEVLLVVSTPGVAWGWEDNWLRVSRRRRPAMGDATGGAVLLPIGHRQFPLGGSLIRGGATGAIVRAALEGWLERSELGGDVGRGGCDGDIERGGATGTIERDA
jgi:hypothetical protein